jgi:hypothetical protein
MFMGLCSKCRLQFYDRYVSKQSQPLIVKYQYGNLKWRKNAISQIENEDILKKLHASRKSRRL